MFIENKYTSIYYQIIENARNKSILTDDYKERHHVVPKSLGGSNDPSNLVELTAREHFICHRLLVKMTTGDNKRKMAWAVRRMLTGINNYHKRHLPNSKKYEHIRIHTNREIQGWFHSEETKKHLSSVLKGRKFSKETIEKMSLARKGKKQPDHVAHRLRTANLGKSMSTESKRKLSKSLTGRIISEEARKNMSLNHANFSGGNNPRAKKWKIQDPNGKTYIVEGEMTEFCLKHNLPASTMRGLGRTGKESKFGRCVGWKVTLLNS
jgi:hypothetical protein